jgi:hypothetical protein
MEEHALIESLFTPQVQFLRTCRQVYIEICPIFWSINAFSFDEDFALKEFLTRLNASQWRLIRDLRIQVRGLTWPSLPWRLPMSLIRSLEGLTHLDLWFASCTTGHCYTTPWPGQTAMTWHLRQNEAAKQITKFGVLALKSVTLSFEYFRDEENNKAWSTKLKGTLLNTDGEPGRLSLHE